MNDEVIETVSFGYDLKDFGVGNYDYSAHDYQIIHIPIDVIDKTDDEGEAFEQYTGLDRCHMLYHESEPDEVFDIEKTQMDLDKQEQFLEAERQRHYQICVVCQRTKQTRYL